MGPSSPPAPPDPALSREEADQNLAYYEENVMACETEERLDSLWTSRVTPVIEAGLMDDVTLAKLQGLDDQRRGQLHQG